MLWFRTEVALTVTWGGDPHTPVASARMTRASFAAWREEVRGRSRPWQAHEVVAAIEIRDLVVDVIQGKAEKLERKCCRSISTAGSAPWSRVRGLIAAAAGADQ